MFLQTPAICLRQTGIGKQKDWFAKYRYRRMCTQKQEIAAVVRGIFLQVASLQTRDICMQQTGFRKQQNWFPRYRPHT